jgi:hypothetical protein
MKILSSGTKNNLSTWVFAVTMLLSIFCFFNDAGNYAPVRRGVAKIELPGSSFKTATRSVPYQPGLQSSLPEINFPRPLRWDELYFEHKIKVRLTNNLKTFFFRTHRIFYSKALHQNPDKEDIDSIRG